MYSIVWIWHQKWRLIFEPLTNQSSSARTFMCRPTLRSPETPGRLKHIQKYHDMSLILEQVVGRSRTGLLPMWLLMVFRVKPTGNVYFWCYVTEIMILTQTTMFSSTSPNCECNPPSQSFISEDVFDKPLGSFTKTFWKLASCVCGKNGILWKRRVQLCLWSQNQTRKTRTRSSPNADHTLNLTRSLGQCCHSIKMKTEHKDVESWDV